MAETTGSGSLTVTISGHVVTDPDDPGQTAFQRTVRVDMGIGLTSASIQVRIQSRTPVGCGSPLSSGQMAPAG